MKQIFDQFLQFLQQGIAAIFRFVQLVWTWSIDQITKMTQAPWGNWPLWKQILLIIVIAVVAFILLVAARRLWFAGMRVLAAFVRFFGVLVYTLPAILLAGCVALAGLWAINNLNLSSLPSFTMFQGGSTGSPSQSNDKPAAQTAAPGAGETTGSRQ
jgi:hypothetical protein